MKRKIKVIAKIERDAKNWFFVKILYGYADSEEKLKTVYKINHKELQQDLISLSYIVFKGISLGYDEKSIIFYDVVKRTNSQGYDTYEGPNKIVVGTNSNVEFSTINHLVHLLSYAIEKEKLGEFFVQYNDELMTEEAFYEFQRRLSIDAVL